MGRGESEELRTFILIPDIDSVKVGDTGIVVVLTGEYNGIQVSRVSIGDRMASTELDIRNLRIPIHREGQLTAGVPSTEA